MWVTVQNILTNCNTKLLNWVKSQIPITYVDTIQGVVWDVEPAMIRVQLTRPTLKKITKKVLNTNWLKKI